METQLKRGGAAYVWNARRWAGSQECSWKTSTTPCSGPSTPSTSSSSFSLLSPWDWLYFPSVIWLLSSSKSEYSITRNSFSVAMKPLCRSSIHRGLQSHRKQLYSLWFPSSSLAGSSSSSRTLKIQWSSPSNAGKNLQRGQKLFSQLSTRPPPKSLRVSSSNWGT